MIRIYRESFRFFAATLPILLGFAGLIEGLLWVLQPKSEAGATFAALAIMAYYFHRHFLFAETFGFRNQQPAEGAPPFKFGCFLLISFLTVSVPVGIAVVIALNATGELALGVLMLTLFPLYLVALSLFGTALPASVARDGTYRLSQGLRATFQTMWRLVLGPGVVGLVLLVLVVLCSRWIEALPDDSLILLAYFTVGRLMGFLPTILAVAVLCEMYRRTRPVPLTQGTGAAA